MSRLFHNLKLRDKLLLMYFCCVFIPIVLTNIVFYNVTTNNVRNQKMHDADIALTQLQREFRSVIDEAAGISYLYYIDPLLNEHLNHTYASDLEYVEALANIKSLFNKSEQANRSTSSTVIYTDNPTILSSGPIMPLSGSVKESGWYKQFQKVNVAYPSLIHDGDTISLVQRLNYTREGTYSSIIKIDLNMSTATLLFANAGFEGNIYFVSPDGTVQYSNDSGTDWKSGAVPLAEVRLPKQRVAFEQAYSNNNYLNGWELVGVLNEHAALQEVRKSAAFVLYLALLNFVLPTVIIAVISGSIHKRLVRILKHMKKVKIQRFEIIPGEQPHDEIGQLTLEFNRMTERIDRLIHDVYEADIAKKDLEIRQRQAQLHALHSQINPHFLFNALETIRMRSLMKGETETARTVQYMAKIFRQSVSWKKSWVTVREELELIECFLEIQKYRFGDKLKYQLTVEDAVYDQLIPKMSFLPFVENASIHGVESSPGIGYIALHIGFEADRLLFRLSDNGAGMTASQLSELLDYLHKDEAIGDSVGMKNVLLRLKLCYKDQFGFEMDSREGMGTFVQLKLPPGA